MKTHFNEDLSEQIEIMEAGKEDPIIESWLDMCNRIKGLAASNPNYNPPMLE